MRSDSNPNLPQREWGRFGILLFALVAHLVALPFLPESAVGGTALEVSWYGVVVAGLLIASRNRKALWSGLLLAIPVLVLRWMEGHSDLLAVRVANSLSSALFLAFVTGVVLKSVFSERRVTIDEILGGVIAYLLIGVVFAQLHHAIELAHPGSYLLGEVALSEVSSAGGELFLTFLYFSFTTLTTLGYGDIRPAVHAARMLSSGEAVIGALYLTILVARLVGAYISQRKDS